MISPTEGWTRERVDAAATAASLRLRIEIEGASATLAVRALREGHYAAILPEIASVELAGSDVIVMRPAFLRALERRPVTGRAVEAIQAVVQRVEIDKVSIGLSVLVE